MNGNKRAFVFCSQNIIKIQEQRHIYIRTTVIKSGKQSKNTNQKKKNHQNGKICKTVVKKKELFETIATI